MSLIASRRPADAEYSSDYHRQLVTLLEGDCALKILSEQTYWLCELASHLSTEQVDKIHPPYGWTIRQVFEHCTNAERVFGYRMMRLAAGDETSLPGWDENMYADSRFGLGNFGQMVEELGALRNANVLLLRRIIPSAWDRQAEADGNRVSVRAIAWIAAGHLHHHLAIVEKRCRVRVQRTPPASMM